MGGPWLERHSYPTEFATRFLAELETFCNDFNALTRTFNQGVPGSSPGALTKKNRPLRDDDSRGSL